MLLRRKGSSSKRSNNIHVTKLLFYVTLSVVVVVERQWQQFFVRCNAFVPTTTSRYIRRSSLYYDPDQSISLLERPFIPYHSIISGTTATTQRTSSKQFRRTVQLHLSPQEQQPTSSSQFDMTKPIFDLYTFRMVRNDALIKYNTLNQSEPLRINILFFLSFTLLILPYLLSSDTTAIQPTASYTVSSLSSSVDTSGQRIDETDIKTIITTVVSILGSIGSFAGALQQCNKRAKQIDRIENEYRAYNLPFRLPRQTTNPLVYYDTTVQSDVYTIGTFIKTQTNAKLFVVAGTVQELQQHCELLVVLGTTQRLQQANTFVLFIPTNSDKYDSSILKRSYWIDQFYKLTSSNNKNFVFQWFGDPISNKEWIEYIVTLQQKSSDSEQLSTFSWFGFSSVTGRSFGSGRTYPNWIQLMGTLLLPATDISLFAIDYDNNNKEITSTSNLDSTTSTKDIILELQSQFYKALTTGDSTKMTNYNQTGTRIDTVFDERYLSDEVTAIIEQGGRIDSWEYCLQETSRPTGMIIGDTQYIQLSDDTAYTTTIEFPPSKDRSISLLAIQTWKLVPTDADGTSSSTSSWKLVQHQTIPWTSAVRIPVSSTLLCDCRGCVSLTQTSAK